MWGLGFMPGGGGSDQCGAWASCRGGVTSVGPGLHAGGGAVTSEGPGLHAGGGGSDQ